MLKQENHNFYTKKEKPGNGYIWNSAAGLVNAGESVILSMVVTRTDGMLEAGILSVAFAVGNLMMTIGKFGVRDYQATDVKGQFSFADYFWTRVLTSALMLLTTAGYLLYGTYTMGYSGQKAAVVAAICMIYTIESVEDVFWGLYQQRQSLDTGAKVFLIRWLLILAAVAGLLAAGKGLAAASVAGAAVCLAAFLVFNTAAFLGFHEKLAPVRWQAVWRILRDCAPLAAVSFFSFYVTNAPKYAIDRHLPQEVQACYGFVAMPVFVIGLLNGFIYQPALVRTALEWKEGRVASFRRRAVKQCFILCGLTVVCVFGAYVCGIPVLSFLYHADLRGYRDELLLLVFSGGMLAYTGYFCVLLTIMRRQKLLLYVYGTASVPAFLFMDMVVKHYGVMGAAVFYTFLMSVLAGGFGSLCRRKIKDALRKDEGIVA